MAETFTFEDASAAPASTFSFEEAAAPKTFSFEDAHPANDRSAAEAELRASAANPPPPADLSKVTVSPYEKYQMAVTKGGPSETFAQNLPAALNPDWDFLRATHGDPIMAVPLAIGAKIAGAENPEEFPFKPLVSLPQVSDEDLKNLHPYLRKAAVVANQVNKTLESFLSPEQLAQLPALEAKGVQMMFLGKIAAQSPELLQNIHDAKTPDERLAAQTQLGIQLGMAGLLAKGVGGDAIAKRLADTYVPRGAGIEGSRPPAPDQPVPVNIQTPGQPAPAANAAEAAAAIVPERPETIAAQMDWLKQGKRNAVLVTPGADLPPLPEGTELHPTDAGTFIFDPEQTSPEQIDQAVAENKVGDLLGYGIPEKPTQDVAGVVTIRGRDGVEKQAVVTDQEHLLAVMDRAKQLAGEGDTIAVETPDQVLAGRRAPAATAPTETPNQRLAREAREAMAALRTQKSDDLSKVGDAGKGIVESLYGGMFDRLSQGKYPEAIKNPTGDKVLAENQREPFKNAAEIRQFVNDNYQRASQPQPVPKVKDVAITKADYDAARKGNSPFMEVGTATGLAKDIKRTQEFGEAAFTERAGETQPQPVNQLYVGDRFALKGEPMRVAEWVTDADTGKPAGVNVDGAFGKQFIPVDQVVHIDKGSLTDPVQTWFDKAIQATSPIEGKVFEGVSSAPYWMTKTAVNGALKLARFTYVKTRDISRSVGEAMRFLRAQKLAGHNDAEAMNWLESNLRGDPVFQDTGKAIGAAAEDRRGILNSSPRQVETGSNLTTLPFQQDLQSAVTGEGWRQRVGGWLGSMAGETFPRTTRIARKVGEQGARWISSRQAAVPLADAFAEDVTRGLDLNDVEFGALLHEDNLRSLKAEAIKAEAAAQVAGDVATVARLQKQIANIFSFVGEGGVWKDEQAYQNYLQIPRVQEALRRHREAWSTLIDPMYKEAMKIDAAEQLPTRGEQTGARINLNFVREGEPVGKDTFVGTAAPRGQLANVLQKRSPFGRLAKGTAIAYKPSYLEAMRNTYSRQLEIANRNKFDRLLVESGNAIVDQPGKQAELRIKGEGVTPFEIKRTVIQTNGKRIPAFENIYVRNSLAAEYRHALNLDPKFSVTFVTPLSKLTNGLALAGLTEISAHLGNLAHALMWRPGVTRNVWSEAALAAFGRADALVGMMKAFTKFSAEDHVRLRELSEIGALRDPHPPGSAFDPRTYGTRVIEWADRHARVQMDRMYDNLVEQGLVPKTETARREFINQIGQYNRRAQGQVMHWLRDTGVAPFVTAGRAFNVLALKTAALSPGIETLSTKARVAVAATMASKVGGTMLLIGTLNYLLTHNKGGGALGRPGTPFGAVDLGIDDKNRRPLTLDVSNILGLKRVARVTGIRGAAESLRYHLPIGTTLDSAYRDIQNAWLAPVTGPLARTVSIGVSGQAPGIGIPRVAPVVPPGESQTFENWKTAALEANQIIAGIHDANQPGATGWEWLQKQAGRFTLQPGKPAQMVATPTRYAGIVDRAQAAGYIEDVISRARKMQGADRANYVRQAIMNLKPADRQHALLTLEQRGIIPPGVVPR